jgi:hypothetical protein
MTNDVATDHERYVVEVDGVARAEYGIFVKALRAGLQLKQELPDSRAKTARRESTASALTRLDGVPRA